MSEGEEHHVKNDDEIDGSHKSQFEYEVYLLNCTTKILKNLNWAFEVLVFLKKPKNWPSFFQTQSYNTALTVTDRTGYNFSYTSGFPP